MGNKLTEKPFQSFAILAAIVLVFAFAWWGISRPELTEDADSAPLSEQLEMVGETQPVDETAEVSAPEIEPAKRIVHVPDTRREDRSGPSPERLPPEATVQPVAADAAENLEKAMDGNLSAAIKVKRAISRCERVSSSESGLEATTARIQRLLAHRERMGRPVEHPFEPTAPTTVPGAILFPTLEQNITRQTALYNECNKMRTVFTDELRKNLDELAQKGDVMARYLYAIWPPSLTFSVDSLESDWEWSQKAYAYSTENLFQGEPAGLLAFGQSYSNGLFTRANPPLGNAVMRAALRCEGGDEDARIAEAFDDQTFIAIVMKRDGYPMHEDPDIVAFEKQLSELCR